MTKWKINIKQNKQEGQLDKVNNFLDGPRPCRLKIALPNFQSNVSHIFAFDTAKVQNHQNFP